MTLLRHRCDACGRKHRDVWPMYCGAIGALADTYTRWYCETPCCDDHPGIADPTGTRNLRRNQGTT